MSFGSGQFENAYARERLDRLLAKADAGRAARVAGRTSLFRRLRERRWPRRQAPQGGREIPRGTFGDPGR